MGDHHAWQKESFFDVSCRVPYLVSWPARLARGQRREEFVTLTDLFGIATTAAGAPDLRQGSDVLGMLDGRSPARERVVGMYGVPGTPRFKIMVREGDWKYIFMANGGREQLFNLREDPDELVQRIDSVPDAVDRLRRSAISAANVPNADRALDSGRLRTFPFERRPDARFYQFDHSRGVKGFPEHPGDVLKDWRG